jgi:hypothetical protein
MDLDRLRPGQVTGRQSAGLRRYVADEVYPYSRLLRPRLDRSGLGATGLRTVADLQRLSPVEPDELGSHVAVLAVSGDLLKAHAPLLERLRLQIADLTKTRAKLARERVEPRYKPIHWCTHGGLRMAMTATDLDKLGDLGRRLLDTAGVRADDRVVTLEDPGSLAFWQLTLGCRAGGVLAEHVGPTADAAVVVAARPTVLVGTPAVLHAILADGPPDGLRVIVALADPSDGDVRSAVAALAPAAQVRMAWAPTGARALWVECERGHLHTWPDAEVIEIVDPLTDAPARGAGSLLWSALHWRGTVALRFRTGSYASIDLNACTCGRTTPRLSVVALDPPFAVSLDADARVDRWFAELDGVGAHLTPRRLFVSPAGGRRRGLREDLAAAHGTEVRLVRPDRIDALIAANGGDRVARTQQ